AAGLLVDTERLIRTGQKRGTRYQLPIGDPDDAERPLSDACVSILALFEAGKWYSRAELLDNLDLTVSVWNRAIAELLERELVVRRGERRGARYTLAETEAAEARAAQGSAPASREPAAAATT